MLFTCPKLTAGDQAQWAWDESKDVDPKILALSELIFGGIHPWDSLDNVDSTVILTGIIRVATKYSVSLDRYIGLPKERSTELKAQHDMI
mgnify:CR=1 FL=1